MMTTSDILRNIGETLGTTASVRSVFGEPIHANGKTIVPVARVAYGFGGGFGSGKNPKHADQQGEGGGGGGGVRAFPAGVLEITETRTRFVPFVDPRLFVAAAGAAALGLALVLNRRR
jgi:uncharacterized spore protein YtfJ